MTVLIERVVVVRCSVRHAFDVFTSRIDTWWPRGHRRFDASELHLDTQVGGRFVERSATGEEALLGEVLACAPPDRIVYTWFPGAISAPTEVEVRFSEVVDGTRVEVLHREGEAALGEHTKTRVALFVRGWTHVLAALADAVAASTAPSGEEEIP